MKKGFALFHCLIILCMVFTGAYAEGSSLDEILLCYEGKEITLSNQLQIVQNNVNFRNAPGGEILGRLQGGTILECLDEIQYQEKLWYHARSDEFGEGYVDATFAKPLWDNLSWWPLSPSEDVFSDNMALFSCWFGTYQLDHGLSIIETFGNDRLLNIAPLTVRGDSSIIPEDARVQLAEKLFEYGLICKNDAYDRLLDDTLPFAEKDSIASDILMKHYGTDDIWKIMVKMSVLSWIHINDLHARPEGPFSERDRMLSDKIQQKVVHEH